MILLTPAYTAGVLAEEKERGTLEALLATDLRNREIVLGLFLARLLNLTLLLLTGLPILSFLQFLGGVDPNLVVSAFVTAGCTMVSLASVSFLCSLYARRSRDAIVRSYLLTLGYLVLSGLSWLLLLPQLKLAGFPSTDKWLSPITLQDVVHTFNYGNIVSVAFQLAAGVVAGRALNDLLWDTMPKYAWFHGLIAVGCCTGRCCGCGQRAWNNLPAIQTAVHVWAGSALTYYRCATGPCSGKRSSRRPASAVV